MRLSSLWSSITGSKIKEIAPQNQCPWLDANRPATSIGGTSETRSSPARTSLPASDGRPASARSANARRASRGFSLSKRKSDLDWKKQEHVASDVEPEVPQVPSVPPIFAQAHSEPTEQAPPGTAVSTDESVSTDVFELSADQTVLTEQKPLRIRSEGALPSKRRKSSASEMSRDRRRSWFQHGTGHNFATSEPLPPPLPPPQTPLPPPPPPPTTLAEKPSPSPKRPLSPQKQPFRDSKMRMSKPSLDEDSSNPPKISMSGVSRSSMGSMSMLEAFPLVPSPPATSGLPFDSAVDLGYNKSSLDETVFSSNEGSAQEQQRPTIGDEQPIDAAPQSSPHNPSHKHKHSRESKPLPAIPREAKRDEIQICGSQGDDLIGIEALRDKDGQEGDDLLRHTSPIEDQRNDDAVETLRDFGIIGDTHPVHKFSNTQALAALEFGV